ncbi:MAG: hypothetical protein K0M45_00365 [Candidatus Paracaedibacteraceae bacterium]|nr:hypothetical protein [Candidatus Paracaedibacteraceae bacterium]
MITMLIKILVPTAQIVFALTLVYSARLILKRINLTESVLLDLNNQCSLKAELDNITFSNISKRVDFLKNEIFKLRNYIELATSAAPKKRGRPSKESKVSASQ